MEGSKGGGIAFGDEYKNSVTGFTVVSQVPHGEVLKPPSSGRRVNGGGAWFRR